MRHKMIGLVGVTLALTTANPVLACSQNIRANGGDFYEAVKTALRQYRVENKTEELNRLSEEMLEISAYLGSEEASVRSGAEDRILTLLGAERGQIGSPVPKGHFQFNGQLYQLRC